MSVRKLYPGQAVRVERNARIVAQTEKDNPYWYTVAFDEDGQQENVSLARINAVADVPRAVVDTDGSIQIFSPRLSAAGAVELHRWLESHLHEFGEQEYIDVTPVGDDPEAVE